jgi:hypothetical protein
MPGNRKQEAGRKNNSVYTGCGRETGGYKTTVINSNTVFA